MKCRKQLAWSLSESLYALLTPVGLEPWERGLMVGFGGTVLRKVYHSSCQKLEAGTGIDGKSHSSNQRSTNHGSWPVVCFYK